MKDKITKHLLLYPKGYEPDYLIPSEYSKYRFAIGKLGADPLVAICMNPSAARDESSDRTINRIIRIRNEQPMQKVLADTMIKYQSKTLMLFEIF